MYINFPSIYLDRCKQRSESEVSAFALLLYELVYETKPKLVVEIGVNRGGISTHILLKALHSLYTIDPNVQRKLVSIDIKDFSYTIAKHNPIRKYWEFHKADSREFYKTWNSEIDILFLDGSHVYNDIKSDYLCYEPFVKRGGYILLHDTKESVGVKKFWNEDHIKYPKVEFNWLMGLGVINKI